MIQKKKESLIRFIRTTITDPISYHDDQLSQTVLMRKVALFWLPISSVFAIIFLSFGLYISAVCLFLITANHVLCIYLSTNGYSKLPRILETIIPTFLIFVLACFEFPVSHTMKLLLIILNLSLLSFAFIFFSLKEWIYIVLGACCIFIYGAMYEYLGPQLYRGNGNVLVHSFLFENAIYLISISMLCLCFYFFKSMIEHQVMSIKQLLVETTIQKEEIETQRDEIESQRDYVFKQKEQIEQSILYAKQIQHAILPSEHLIHEYFSENFIYFKPKDIVSGDFYWIANVGVRKIIIAADCTGHGVPGAFMSVLGITFLNEIVKVEQELKPEAILNNLRDRFVKLFAKEGEYIQKDGMDVTVSIVDMKKHTLEFAGANNNIYIISGDEFHEISGDKMPVGFSFKNEPFTNKTFTFNKGDSLYMFSDGYRDQFGGPNIKRFKTKRFRQVLKDNNLHSMDTIGTVIHTTFEEWKGKHEQIDDVLVMGFRI